MRHDCRGAAIVETPMNAVIRLTSLAHGGGCGCVCTVRAANCRASRSRPYHQLLVGTETGDDAAVWQVDANTCIIATADFFMPVADDLTILAASLR
jgi:selenide,water dikinase